MQRDKMPLKPLLLSGAGIEVCSGDVESTSSSRTRRVYKMAFDDHLEKFGTILLHYYRKSANI